MYLQKKKDSDIENGEGLWVVYRFLFQNKVRLLAAPFQPLRRQFHNREVAGMYIYFWQAYIDPNTLLLLSANI